MNIFKQTSNFICTTLKTAEDAVSIGSVFVQENAKGFRLTTKESVQIRTMNTLHDLKKEVDQSETHKEIYDELVKNWDTY